MANVMLPSAPAHAAPASLKDIVLGRRAAACMPALDEAAAGEAAAGEAALCELLAECDEQAHIHPRSASTANFFMGTSEARPPSVCSARVVLLLQRPGARPRPCASLSLRHCERCNSCRLRRFDAFWGLGRSLHSASPTKLLRGCSLYRRRFNKRCPVSAAWCRGSCWPAAPSRCSPS